MSNVSKIQKIIERLNTLEDTEMMYNELNERLEKEMKKPEDQIDLHLVEELLDLLAVQRPKQEEQAECWTAIQNGMEEGKRAKHGGSKRRYTLIAAVVMLAILTTIGTASAFRWGFLRKLLSPLAETFGIYTASSFDSGIVDQPPVEGVTEYTFADTEYVQIPFDTLESMPKEEYGCRLVPEWTPERFAFAQGSIYEDPDVLRSSATYLNGDEVISVSVTYYFNQADVGSYTFEKEPEDLRPESIGDWQVDFYTNMDKQRLSAVWIVENAQYLVQGDISEDEMRHLIESMQN